MLRWCCIALSVLFVQGTVWVIQCEHTVPGTNNTLSTMQHHSNVTNVYSHKSACACLITVMHAKHEHMKAYLPQRACWVIHASKCMLFHHNTVMGGYAL